MKKLVFGITSLGLGGAERVLVDIANKLKDDYEISILTIYGGGEFEKTLDSKIKLESIYNRPFNSMNWIKRKLAVLRILLLKGSLYKKYIYGKYDIEIAFLEGPVTRLFSIRKNKTRKIAWIHNDISKVYGNSLIAKLKKNVDQKAYSKYDSLIFVSEDNLSVFENEYKKLDKIKKEVIYNYIDSNNVIQKASQDVEELSSNDTSIVTVTRLVEQKAIDRLIRVHKKLLDDGINHKIYVVGDGPERHKLEKQISDYKVENTFILLGKKENPYPYIKTADCFVLFSYYEGYGMVIEEAKILDKFIMITDTAAREALKGYDKSKITENTEEGIYKAIKDFVLNKQNFRQNEENIVKYNNEEILEEIKKLMGD